MTNVRDMVSLTLELCPAGRFSRPGMIALRRRVFTKVCRDVYWPAVYGMSEFDRRWTAFFAFRSHLD